MREHVLPAVRLAAVTLFLTGIAYPLVTTGIAELLFPHAARGSLIADASGRIAGSELIGQGFSRPEYFQPRPSAAGERGYDAGSSGGSNLAPSSRKLRDRVTTDAGRLARENPRAGPVPADLVTASASGLDPHVSPEAARWQAPRVAAARGVATERVLALVDEAVEGRDLGFLGEPRVHVLRLNLALDRQFGAAAPRRAAQAREGAPRPSP